MLDIALRIVNVSRDMNHIHRQDKFIDGFHTVNYQNGNGTFEQGNTAEPQDRVVHRA